MAWNRILPAAFLFFFFSDVFALDLSKEFVLVYFKDKEEILPDDLKGGFSPQSLARRMRQGIEMDQYDYPVNQNYVSQLTASGISVVDSSRWLNAVLIAFPKNDKKTLKNLSRFEFIERYQFLGGKSRLEQWNQTDTISRYSEVETLYQASLKAVGLDTLHQLGFRGKGIQIALADAGYIGVDTFEAFAHLHTGQQIREVVNFTDTTGNIFNESIHGTKVLSLFSGKNGQKIIGAAPDASFWLLKTEKEEYEHPIEEFYYVKALEYCDKAGVDIVNASIGYYSFDDEAYDYQASDLYQNRSLSTRASQLAAGRGMLVVTSAGNEGNLRWKEVTFPADAENILAVAVTNLHGRPTSYASYGRDSIDVVRPNVAAPGHKVYTIDEKGTYSLSFGSSYAAPLISAAAACLWEKYPHLTVAEIIDLFERSGSHYPQHHLQTGYGMPDMRKIVHLLDNKK